jgi:hypothetical protein
MKYIYVLEDDVRIQKELFETLKSIDPSLDIRYFKTLEEFHLWLKNAMTKGAVALPEGGSHFSDDTSPEPTPAATDELRLIICKDEMLGPRNMALIRRARDFLVRKKITPADEPHGLIFTAFDSPSFDLKLAEDRIVNNVIFKPFDKLILKQDLQYALTGRHPVKADTVAALQIKSTIEMLKEVQLDAISEIGFTSINNHEIRIGALTKYYSDAFTAKTKRSAFAYCSSCKEIGPEKFECEFRFFGIDNLQISEIRKHVVSAKKHTTEEFKNTFAQKSRFLILDENPQAAADFDLVLKERLENAEVFHYTSYGQFMSDAADKDTPHRQEIPEQFDYVIANLQMFEEEQKKRWDNTIKTLEDRAKAKGVPAIVPDLYIYSKKEIPIDVYRTYSGWVKDILYLPLDKSYFMKKLITNHPGVINKNPVTVNRLIEEFVLQVANPVETAEISEAGLVLKYYRGIGIGSFREFVFWLPDELETPEIIATCNFTEQDKSNPAVFLNHFVFFGVKDLHLKHIRLWTMNAYIKSKDKES